MSVKKLKAVSGIKVPMEFKPREYITEDKAEVVEMSAYYKRRMKDGDLIEVASKQTKKD